MSCNTHRIDIKIKIVILIYIFIISFLIWFLDETFGVNATSAVVPYNATKGSTSVVPISAGSNMGSGTLTIPQKKMPSMTKPKWHAPWKLYRVISGHLGWVRCCAVEPGNEWFATGSADRVIKVSARSSYLFNNVSEHIIGEVNSSSMQTCY